MMLEPHNPPLVMKRSVRGISSDKECKVITMFYRQSVLQLCLLQVS